MPFGNRSVALVGRPAAERVESVIDVAPVWAGHPVGFALLTHKDRQYVAFYDADRQMTIGERRLNAKTWTFAKLPERVVWDSHNYVTMTVDDDGCLHVSGNMHVVPLVYFRTTKPLDITTFERVRAMTGDKERRVTYPLFFRGPGGALYFTYRDGSSGDGEQIYNVYNHRGRTWKRALDRPLTDGEGQRNAYPQLPQLGPDGYFHLVWVWRETPDASTNHDPSYARSKDLVHWETAAGKPIPLPITLQTGDVVDPVPEKGGVVNGNVKIGFDHQKRPIVTYHKYDPKGNTQIYAARHEAGGWKIYTVSDWNYRWEFGGGGSIPFEVGVSAVAAQADGTLLLPYRHNKFGSGRWVLDEDTLKPIRSLPPERQPEEISKITTAFPGMQVRTAGDSGSSGEKGVRYLLRWETLGPNRDRPRQPPLPGPTMLRLYRLRAVPE